MNFTSRVTATVILAGALAMGLAGPAHADSDPIIEDGTFEAGFAMYPHIYSPSDAIGGWSVTDGSVAIHAGGHSGPGSEQATLYNYDPAVGPVVSSISQSFETTVAGRYQVSYWIHGEGQFEALVESATVDTVDNTPFTWTQRVVVFTADSINTTLTFRSSSDSPNDEVSAGFVDDVEVSRLPDGAIADPLVVGGAATLAVLAAAAVLATRRGIQRRITA